MCRMIANYFTSSTSLLFSSTSLLLYSPSTIFDYITTLLLLLHFSLTFLLFYNPSTIFDGQDGARCAGFPAWPDSSHGMHAFPTYSLLAARNYFYISSLLLLFSSTSLLFYSPSTAFPTYSMLAACN